MGKIILIKGKNNSGKSEYAEKLCEALNENRFYIATMLPVNNDNLLRIKKHRKKRAHLNFKTLELPYTVKNASVIYDSVVLLEDASNLLSNNIFDKKKTFEDVFSDIKSLSEKCDTLIVVTIEEEFYGDFNKETISYINSLKRLNTMLEEISFRVERIHK